MKKLEPGMLCRVVLGAHKGKVLTLVEFIGSPPLIIAGEKRIRLTGGDWWRTDAVLGWPGHPDIPPDSLMCGKSLQPINPDHKPADEEFQELFNNMLSGNKQTVKSGC